MSLLTVLVLFILNTDCWSSSAASVKTLKIIPKCCSENHAVFMNITNYVSTCKPIDEKKAFENFPVYDRDIHDKKTQVSFTDIFRVAPEKAPDNFQDSYQMYEPIIHMRLNVDGVLYLEYPNAYLRWVAVNSSYYCADYEVSEDGNITETFNLWCSSSGKPPSETSTFYKTAIIISSAFLFLVLVVYLLLPDLRNLCGKVLMAYVFSLLLAFVFLSTIQLQQHTFDACIRLTTAAYFFFLASFCWMNVMSYDIWWTFRGYAKARPIHRRGETFKFFMYCIYAWGVPLAMSVAFVVINGSEMPPWFVKPLVPEHGCFLEEGQKLVYLYAPMLILIICNWIFFLMTAFNIWRLNRATAVLDSPAAGTPAAHRNQRARFFIYLKLSIIMGINWILEVVSSLTPNFSFWMITDSYNLLIGLAIFLTFVCKKKIFKDLKVRFQQHQRPQRSLAKSQTSCTTLSNSSQDTPLQVYLHPNGTSKR